jgi:hypothetical protein
MRSGQHFSSHIGPSGRIVGRDGVPGLKVNVSGATDFPGGAGDCLAAGPLFFLYLRIRNREVRIGNNLGPAFIQGC